ncbi:MAG: DUF7524 family protein [Methanosarcinaceae archaeon]
MHINRLGVNSIEFDNDTIEIPLSPGGEHSLEFVIINYGSPTHVHLSASESLIDNLIFLDNNPYVRHEEYVPIMVRIPPGGRLFNSGQMHVAVGYGSKKESFNVKIGIPDPDEVPMEVDVADQLYNPQVRHNSTSSNTSRDWNVQFYEMSNQLLNSILESLTPRSISLLGIMSIILIILYFVIQATTIVSIELDEIFQSLIFYVAIAFSILFTAFIAYLIIKLPISK